MDVRLSAEHEALRDSVAQVVDRLAPQAVGQIGQAERSALLDVAVVESGWRELRAANDDGSPLASGVEVALVAEELGRGVADTPFIGPTLALELRRLAGAPNDAGAETVAFDTRLRSIVVAHLSTGAQGVAVDAAGAQSAHLLIAADNGYRLAQVDLEGELCGPDLTRPAMRVDPSSIVHAVDGADRPISAAELDGWRALGLALSCADLVGVMRGAVRLACDYAAERRQYGAAIGSFQAIQHLLADAFVVMEGSRSVARHAAWAADALPSAEALAAAAMAKAFCARSARSVCETVIQVHGGIGNTWECLAHVYLRRALVSIDILGDDRDSLARVLELEGIGGRHGLR
jgi:alkylation response protein AidB-like acyl-CoA dehydrogenase